MEKFAVDLEKVLDEFEFNEEREEQDTPPTIKNQPLPHLGLCQIPPSRPPAASYRRPTFEPINLSEADFAASPPSTTSTNFNNDILKKTNLNSDSCLVRQNGRNNYFIVPSTSTNNIVNVESVTIDRNQEIRADEDSWSGGDSPSSTDEKPDLIDYKPKDAVLPPQLPDVTTSVWSLPNGISSTLVEPLKNSPLCDLVHSSNGNLYEHINHNNVLSENAIHKSLELRTDENIISSKQTEHFNSTDSCSLSTSVQNNVNLLQGVGKSENFVITPELQKCPDEDKGFNQTPEFQDMYRTLEKEDIDDHKIEISGSLNMLHQTTEFQHKNITAANFESSDKKDDNVRSEPVESYTDTKNDQDTAVTNLNNAPSNTDLDKMSTNHDRRENLKEIEINQPEYFKGDVAELNKAVEILPNASEVMKNSTNNAPEQAGKNLCNVAVGKPIGFTSNNDLSDSELQQYLDELESLQEEELCLDVEQSKFDKDIPVNETNVLPLMTRNVFTSESLLEINKTCNLTDNIKGLGKKSSNINRKESNLDLSSKLSDHISGVNYVSQPSYLDMNPEQSSSTLTSDNSVLTSVTVQEFENNNQLTVKENVEMCENNLAIGQISIVNTFLGTVSPNSLNVTQITTDNIIVESVTEVSENNNKSVKSVRECKDEENLVEIKKHIIDNPSSANENQNIVETEASADSNLVKSSKIDEESLNQVEVANEMNSNQPSEEPNSELSITEDTISGDSDNSSSYIPKVIKCKQEFGNQNVRHFSEKENSTIDCDSLMSQESLEEDSSNKPVNVANSSSPSSNSEYDPVLDLSTKMIPIKNAIECAVESQICIDEAGVPAEEDKPLRPNSLELPACITVNTEDTSTMPLSPTTSGELELSPEVGRLGKVAPVWVPDSDAPACMQCQARFTVIKRRHHCRACGQVLCSKCCSLKARLEFSGFAEVRVCLPCFSVLETVNGADPQSPLGRQPNPNNPMEYCSTIPPLQQAAGSLHQPPPSVMVPVGVLKREGRSKSDVTKQVMFSDGIRPGGDLTELDGSGEPRIPFRRPGRQTKRVGTPPGGPMSSNNRRALDPNTQSFIPKDGDTALPPVMTFSHGELIYTDHEQPITLSDGPFKFAVNRNLNVYIKRVLLECCVNRECWCISSDGLSCVGQDEVVLLLECLPQEALPPKDIFLLINTLYQNAAKGTTVSEMSFTPAPSNKLFGSRDHGGFLYIRPSYQCTAQLILPPPPYLFALLIHRWETPWARLFPIRLVLRLGAEFRYYPCPLVSVRHRAPLYTDIGHTIINLLADFRKYSYTLPTVRGLVIHMEDRQTSILLPRNRYDQVVRALNNSNDSVLAFGANFSLAADSHLVCMQSVEDESTSYHTQAINIHNKPRRVTGASFVVFNGALKTPGLAGKSNIVEDGLMVQVPSETMIALRTALRDMHDYTIGCGPHAEETVLLQWTADDTNFNVGVKSCIDGRPLDGVPSIRVHSGTDYTGSSKLIRWTEVFILQSEEGTDHTGEPLDISRLSGSIAQATCLALVPLLDLLCAASLTTIAVRANIHPENVGYEAGGNGEKLPPFYMKSLDDELVAVVHQAALAAENTPATLELVFRIMEQG